MVARNWTAFVARLESEAKSTLKNNRHGLCIVTAHIAMGSDGEPMIWVVTDGVRVEPSGDAKEVLLPLLANSFA